jgi:hypothetical protein
LHVPQADALAAPDAGLVRLVATGGRIEAITPAS